MANSTKRSTRLSLADLIDLELQLQRDKHQNLAMLREREADIGQSIGAEELQGRALLLGWLDEMRRRRKLPEPTAGQLVDHLLEVIGLLLFLLGAVLGAAAVAPWLAYDTERPVNVVFFWGALVGVQVLLLLGWLVAVLPRSWLKYIPGSRAMQTLLRAVGRCLPAIFTWLAARFSNTYREAIEDLRGNARQLDWLYGKLRLWIPVRLTQVFAVAYNVGMIVTFLALSYGNDPTFGWKSTMLDDATMHSVVRVISAPWSAWHDAVPTLEQVKATRYTSLDDRFIGRSKNDRAEDVRLWSSWWPFLLASFVFYGLLPRIVTFAVSHWQVRHILSGAGLDHREYVKLQERLHRPQIDTRAQSAESGNGETAGPADAMRLADVNLGTAPIPVLKWAGVKASREQLGELLRARLGAQVSEILSIGDLDEQGDRDALVRLDQGLADRSVVLLVEAWEPPVADYLDFIGRLRESLGDGKLVVVVLYHCNSAGEAVPPRAIDLQIWQRRLHALGDPWLFVEPLIDKAASAGEAVTSERAANSTASTDSVPDSATRGDATGKSGTPEGGR